MKTSTILTIGGLALIFTSVLTWLSARYDVSFEEAPRGTHKKLGPKGRKMTFTITNMLFFAGFVLIGVSQLLGENKDGYKNIPPQVSDCGDMKHEFKNGYSTVAEPMTCNDLPDPENCNQIDSSAKIVHKCGSLVGADAQRDRFHKHCSMDSLKDGTSLWQKKISCDNGTDNVVFTTEK